LQQAALDAAKPYLLRILGPNCVGIMVPPLGLDATFSHLAAPAGEIAFLSQSGAMITAMLDWAVPRSIGFSHVVSLGDMADVDFGDMLDYLAADPHTRAILLYVEGITHGRKFMSAARAASRIKPVLVLKAGRSNAGARAATSHTGVLAGADAVYDAAFRRAGMLRVGTMAELFDAAETLALTHEQVGERLAILTNGGGLGILAVDRLAELGGAAPQLSADIAAKLDAVLPSTWSKANPVDIAGDADATRYVAAFEALLEDRENDAILVMNVPTALAPADAAARSIAACAQTHRNSFIPKPVFAVWVGSSDATTPIFEAAGIPSYATESDAVRGFMHLVRYREALEALMATPPSLAQDFKPDVAAARGVVESALEHGRTWLDPIDITQLLAAYSIPIAPALLARNGFRGHAGGGFTRVDVLDDGEFVATFVPLTGRDEILYEVMVDEADLRPAV